MWSKKWIVRLIWGLPLLFAALMGFAAIIAALKVDLEALHTVGMAMGAFFLVAFIVWWFCIMITFMSLGFGVMIRGWGGGEALKKDYPTRYASLLPMYFVVWREAWDEMLK